MAIPVAAVAGGALLLWAMGKKKSPTAPPPTCPPGTSLVNGQCLASGGPQPAPAGGSGVDGGKLVSTIGGSLLSIGGTVTGALLKTGVAGGTTAATAASTTETAAAIATDSVITAIDVGYGVLGGIFFLLVIGIVIAAAVTTIVQNNASEWTRVRNVGGGQRYIRSILYQEQQQFATTMNQLVNNVLNPKGAPYLSFNPGQVLKPGATDIPYSFTQAVFDFDACQQVGIQYDGSTYYYVNSIDPRLPVMDLANGHVVSRYAAWVTAEALNECLWNFYGTSPLGSILPGTPQAQITGPGGLNPAGRTLFSVEPGQLRSVLEQFFTSLPTSFTAGIPVPGSYDTLRAATSSVLAKIAGGGGTTSSGERFYVPSLEEFEAKARFVGVARALTQAANVGISQTWPGDMVFAIELWNRCGLSAKGWPPPNPMNIPDSPGYGGDPTGWTVFIVDPTNTWAIDVKSSGHFDIPMIYAVPKTTTTINRRTALSRFARFADATTDPAAADNQQAVTDLYNRLSSNITPAEKMALWQGTYHPVQVTPAQGVMATATKLLPLALAAGAAALWLGRKK